MKESEMLDILVRLEALEEAKSKALTVLQMTQLTIEEHQASFRFILERVEALEKTSKKTTKNLELVASNVVSHNIVIEELEKKL